MNITLSANCRHRLDFHPADRHPWSVMPLAIFDLDDTLIATDSDQAWGEFIIEKGLVAADEYRQENNRFHAQYRAGELNINAWLGFCCSLLAQHSMDALLDYRATFIATKIEPLLLSKATALLDFHRRQGDFLIVITSTMEFISRPIVDRLGIETLIAPVLEVKQNRFTGRIVGVPSYAEGKVTRLKDWLEDTDQNLIGSYFYTDSHNDLPLLRQVDNPVAVDPDDKLRQEATANQWQIISLR